MEGIEDLSSINEYKKETGLEEEGEEEGGKKKERKK
jgi:hypothetical protein